jgi:hypothetical protein
MTGILFQAEAIESVKTVSAANPASYPMGMGGNFSGGITDGA